MRPILFSIGQFHIYSFGFMVALGVFLSLQGMKRRAFRYGMTPETAFDIIFITVAAGFLGARLLYIAQNFSDYVSNPLAAFAVWEGGLIFYGGMAGSFFCLYIFSRIKKISFLGILDFALPFVALTHGFGRLGCFLNGCCGGKACDLPWAVRFPETDISVHPAQLYEAAFDFLLFFMLSREAAKKEGDFRGKVSLLYFFFYGAIRFSLEYVRSGNPYWYFLTVNQWFSLTVMAVSAAFYFSRHLWSRPDENA